MGSIRFLQHTRPYGLLGWVAIILILSQHAYANEVKTLKTGVSFSIPPWVIQDSESGIELEILKKSLMPFGYRISPSFVPFARAYFLFDTDKLDLVINAKPGAVKSGYFSEPVVRFQNIAISLADKNFSDISGIQALSNKRVVAFQNASKLLGPEFKVMTETNPNYREIAKQHLQIKLLYFRDVDFIVMDRSIFGYYWNQAYKEAVNTGKYASTYERKIRTYNIFPASDYSFVFKSEQTRNEFNLGLKSLQDSGDYDKIVQKYLPMSDLQRHIVIE